MISYRSLLYNTTVLYDKKFCKLYIITWDFLNKFNFDSMSKYQVSLDQSLKNDANCICR